MSQHRDDEVLIGSSIGDWRLESLVESRAQSRVYLATREDKGFTQTSALRLLRHAHAGAAETDRFARLRSLLAGTEHPNIARFLDGGTSLRGRLWFATEFVVGEPVDTYARRHTLPLDRRLDLFVQICDAVAYLHGRLLVHGELAPGSVLVDARGHVRVLELGGQSDAPGDSRFLPPEWEPGQPPRMSWDVYALGALLALLCRADTAPAAQRRRNDLDRIIEKARRALPAERYTSVAELRADISRFRSHQPILARAQTPAYRSAKFLRRHWLGFSATLVTGLALFIGLGVAIWQADRAILERDRAEAMNRFMQEVLAEADPYSADLNRSVREALVEASALLDERFAQQPELEMALRQTVGGIQVKLRDLEQGEENLNRAIALAESGFPADNEIRLRAIADIAWAHYERDEFAEAIAQYESILALLNDTHPRDLRRTVHNDLGVALNRSGQYEAAITQLEASLDYVGDDAAERAAVLINMGYAYAYLEQPKLAEANYLEAFELLDTLGPSGKTAAYAYALNNYGRVLAGMQREDEALDFYKKSLSVRRDVFGERSDAVGAQMLNTGRLLLDMQRPTEALPYLDDALAILAMHRESDSFYMAIARASQARALLLVSEDKGRREDAIKTLEDVILWLQANRSSRVERFLAQFQEWRDQAQR
ncbi:MAG: hypothetical protein Cons2KO_15260 [Congregibacter sp.]